MSRYKKTKLEERQTKIEARIADIESAYPDIKVKSYSRNYNAVNTAYQDFGAVATEYRKLLNDLEEVCIKLDAFDDEETGTYLAAFRSSCE